jgi:4'-phosphopantetheinyl transferase
MVEALTISSEEIASLPSGELNSSLFMPLNQILWPLGPDRLAPGATDVHVWAAWLQAPPELIHHCASLLAPRENERASRFRFDKHRNRFIAGRAILRSLLGRYLNCPPEKLQFSYGPHGKPSLAAEFHQASLHFNLAHSEDIAVFAVTRLGPVGIDVEQIRPLADADDLVERFFSPRENALFQPLSEDQKSIAFFNLWTRKEAWLKATGEGIAHSLNRVEVTFLPGEPARLIALPERSGSKYQWALRELSPAPEFVGAIALPDLEFAISNFQFSTPQLLRNCL